MRCRPSRAIISTGWWADDGVEYRVNCALLIKRGVEFLLIVVDAFFREVRDSARALLEASLRSISLVPYFNDTRILIIKQYVY